jgi:hypothetical protein
MFKLLKKEGSKEYMRLILKKKETMNKPLHYSCILTKYKSVLYYLLLETSTFDVHLPMIHVSFRWFSIM